MPITAQDMSRSTGRRIQFSTGRMNIVQPVPAAWYSGRCRHCRIHHHAVLLAACGNISNAYKHTVYYPPLPDVLHLDIVWIWAGSSLR
ncbi:hypothetical protein P168DRAFT_35304 [Aspergillus campestris IBT 28561]|uniref:Uncharacterized protein n=1 Tax=Aspergillus campestris (strain IBT 28561) TaxID=1392248 RepID=A0A2I1DHQ7_ASPC2|nr:uncharacterized protein P168DRAFT_35304 [Aspergillus campestris IBT 28561]PKY09399.1 hypothetical protein P168DRAFT_35304 [Aspergillus campestris IBT 28561]